MRKLPIIATYVLVAVAVTIFLAVAIPKIFFPYEAQWLEGAMLTEISWILSGNPLYCTPNISHVPSLYQPFYFYLTSAISTITGLSFPTARITSILASFVTMVMIYNVVRKETGKFFFGVAAVGLYISAFGKTEFSFLMARIDPLLTALLVAASITVYYSRSYTSLIIGALLFALSFFTKQSALVFVPSITLYLLLVRDWKQSFVFTGSVVVLIIIGIVALDIYYDGWYTFYTLSIIQSMSGLARWGYAINGFVFYIFLRCWLVSILIVALPLHELFAKLESNKDRSTIYFGLFFTTGILAGFLGILNSGGGHNVLLQAAAGCAIFYQ